MNKLSSSPKQIINYYETCEIVYKLFWNLDQSHAMHAGYWDEKVKNLTEALERQNEVLKYGIFYGEKT